MRVTFHQPHCLPWVPYLNRLVHADVFVVLDDASFRKNYFQNRTRIADSTGRTYWMTVPVRHPACGTPIAEVIIADDSRMLRRSRNRLREAYRDAPVGSVMSSVDDILAHPPRHLLDLNMQLLDVLLMELGLHRPEILMMSRLARRGPRDERMLAALSALGATRVILGMGRMAELHDVARWQSAGIGIDVQVAEKVPDDCSMTFGAGVSVLHDILRFGPIAAASTVREFWTPAFRG